MTNIHRAIGIINGSILGIRSIPDFDKDGLCESLEEVKELITEPKQEKEERTFTEKDMIGFLDWVKLWFTPIEGTDIWMASAHGYVKGDPPDLSEYTTENLLNQYTKYLTNKSRNNEKRPG